MSQKHILQEKDLAVLAKRARKEARKNRAETGRELGVSHVSIYRAEESPKESLVQLRIRIIERYSRFKVVGPVYFLKRKQAGKL